MNYPSDNIWHIRILVKDFDTSIMSFQFMRAERVSMSPSRSQEFQAYNYRLDKRLTIRVYLIDWHTLEPVFFWEANRKDISICLDKLYLKVYDLPQV